MSWGSDQALTACCSGLALAVMPLIVPESPPKAAPEPKAVSGGGSPCLGGQTRLSLLRACS